MSANIAQHVDFFTLLGATERAPEIPAAEDIDGWLCGSWDLEVLRYRGVDVAEKGLRGEVHAARVLEAIS
jgi:hypothetical protein